jgi:hypothetical protein
MLLGQSMYLKGEPAPVMRYTETWWVAIPSVVLAPGWYQVKWTTTR